MHIGKESIISFFIDTVETIILALALFLVVYIFIMQPHQVNGHSMDPTLETGQYLLTEKISYRFREPLRGDIIVFNAPSIACAAGDCDYIKRIIGVPGDVLRIEDGRVFINGMELDESDYLPTGMQTNPGFFTDNNQDIIIGQDQFFVIGDNRPGSSDSRIWGLIERRSIIGRAFFSYWPISRFGFIEQGNFPEEFAARETSLNLSN
jgi:signal peptidase I